MVSITTMPIRTKACFVLFLLLIFLSGVAPIHSQSQPPSERIAFSAYRNGQWDIYSVAPDGSDLRQLTNDRYADLQPAFSPDGRTIAFATDRAAGTDFQRLTFADLNAHATSTPAGDEAVSSWNPSPFRRRRSASSTSD